jgi:hypothetical protein
LKISAAKIAEKSDLPKEIGNYLQKSPQIRAEKKERRTL